MLTWFKFTHIDYLLNPLVTGLSLSAQGAHTRLMAYAAMQSPFATLPNDPEQLSVMSGVKPKQWEKLAKELIGKVWLVNGDGRLFCPMMIVESAPEAPTPSADSSKKSVTQRQQRNAERQKRYRERNANRNGVTFDSVTRNADTVTQDVTSNANVTDSNVTHRNATVTNEGGKGGDLELDLERELDKDQEFINTSLSQTREAEKKSAPKFFDDELFPDIATLNNKLKISGALETTEQFVREQLFEFNANFETQHLSENQRLAKWVSWIKRKQVDASKTVKPEPTKAQSRRMPPPDNFAQRDYSAGINPDGSF